MTNRRCFLKKSLLSSAGVVAGLGYSHLGHSEPHHFNGRFAPRNENSALTENMLVDLFLQGGPDFRQLIVPKPPESDSFPSDDYGGLYWANRHRSHQIESSPEAWRQRWEQEYVHFTIGAEAGQVGSELNSNQGVEFGVWREAGWLVRMIEEGNAAIFCNVGGYGGRAHDLAEMVWNQGDRLIGVRDLGRSGWGGRLAKIAEGKTVSLTRDPLPFCFGPAVGADGNLNPDLVDNSNLITVQNSRNSGFYEFDRRVDQSFSPAQMMARNVEGYYKTLQLLKEELNPVYREFLNHESKIRSFSGELNRRLASSDVPQFLSSLFNETDLNPDPDSGIPRRVLHNASFGIQCLNLFDCATNSDLFLSQGGAGSVRVASMHYPGWDSHRNQIGTSGGRNLNDPDLDRGIENGFKDIFGGPYSGNPEQLHGGFSAFWEHSSDVDRVGLLDKLVMTIGGEFGRQIKDNGNQGTDHGDGNIVLVIGSQINGGVYGELFPQSEIPHYLDTDEAKRPGIQGLTDIDAIFAAVCNWVEPGTGALVFPQEGISRREDGVVLDNLFSG